jgi:hypothetical protein
VDIGVIAPLAFGMAVTRPVHRVIDGGREAQELLTRGLR